MTKILRGSRAETFCNICNRKTLQIRLRINDILHVGLFCPKCDRTLIDTFKQKGASISKPGSGPNVPWDSQGFSPKSGLKAPYRSTGGDRDFGTRSGKGQDLIAEKTIKGIQNWQRRRKRHATKRKRARAQS
jgi:hypothetical protein